MPTLYNLLTTTSKPAVNSNNKDIIIIQFINIYAGKEAVKCSKT